MDVDAYRAAHAHEWDRLEQLLDRRRSAESPDELVDLYQRVATHLSVVRSASPDPALVSRLSSLVARARSAVVGTPSGWSWRTPVHFVTVGFPAALAESWRWWTSTAVVSLVLGLVLGTWVAADPDVQASIVPPDQVRQLVDHDFADYYSTSPAGSFAAQVWTNNAWLAAVCLVAGVLIVPVLAVLVGNVYNVGGVGGVMAANGRLDVFFGLITPHGLLELTALFVAAGAGLRMGWAWIDPGPRRRADALARAGRTTAGMALGVAGLLAVSGMIEAFVTPSGLPTWARIGIGIAAEVAFLAYVRLGVRRLREGASGDLSGAETSAVGVAA